MTFIEMLNQMAVELADVSGGSPVHIAWPLATKKIHLNSAYKDLYFLIAEYQPSLYLKAIDPVITMETDVHDYDLPADFGKVYRYKFSTDRRWRYHLHRHNHHAHYYFDRSSLSVKGAYGKIAGTEQFAQSVIHHATAGVTMELEYIPSPPVLTADTDIFPIDPMWHELIVLGGCVRCMETKIDDSRYPRLTDRQQREMQKFRIWLNSRAHETDGRFHDHFDERI